MIRSELRHGGAVLHIVLDAPTANILDATMLAGIDAALDAHAGPGLKTVAFEGAGAHFSFGASVAEHTRAAAPAMLAQFHGLFRRLMKLAIPTCAIVRGQCLGGGMELATFCSWVFAAPGARFGQPEIRLAVFPPMASLVLPWRAGGGAALDLCVSGRSVDAATALRMGLCTEVGDDPGGLWESFFAANVATTSAAALRFAERAARGGLHEAMESRLGALERMYLNELMATHDANEGIAAFMERRPARFEDR